MKKVLVAVMALGMLVSAANAGVKKVYVGSTTSQGKQYVIQCTNGRSTSSVHLKSNGYWYSGVSNMGDDYKNKSINGVAETYCR
jgi:hypothetical protein